MVKIELVKEKITQEFFLKDNPEVATEIENKIKGFISGTVDEDTDEGKDNSSAKSDEQK